MNLDISRLLAPDLWALFSELVRKEDESPIMFLLWMPVKVMLLGSPKNSPLLKITGPLLSCKEGSTKEKHTHTESFIQ